MIKVSWIGSRRGLESWVEMLVEKNGMVYRLTQTISPCTEKNFWDNIEYMSSQVKQVVAELDEITIGEAWDMHRNNLG